MPELACINGSVCPIDEAMVPINDRGYQFGDGVYEAFRSYAGKLWAVDLHFKRLEHSLNEIEIPDVETEEVKELVVNVYAQSGIETALVYLQITRGVQPRNHVYEDGLNPDILITVREFTEHPDAEYTDGIKTITLPETRWYRRDIKSLNLLPNCLAMKQADREGAYEPILIENGIVTEAASASLFIVKNGILITRESGHHILPGITRQYILDIARKEGISCEERPYSEEELLDADEVFITASTFAVLGATLINDHVVGNGKTGPVTQKLYGSYMDMVNEWKDKQ